MTDPQPTPPPVHAPARNAPTPDSSSADRTAKSARANYRALPFPETWTALLAPYLPFHPAGLADPSLLFPVVRPVWIQPLLGQLFTHLNVREQHVLRLRLGEGLSYRHAAERIGISREQVRQNEQVLIRKIRVQRAQIEVQQNTLLSGPAIIDLHDLKLDTVPDASPDELWTIYLGLLNWISLPGDQHRAQTVRLQPEWWWCDRADQVRAAEHRVLEILTGGRHVRNTHLGALARLSLDFPAATLPARELLLTTGGHLGHRRWTGLQWLELTSRLLRPARNDWHLSEMAGALERLHPERFDPHRGARTKVIGVLGLLDDDRSRQHRTPVSTGPESPSAGSRQVARERTFIHQGRTGYWRLNDETTPGEQQSSSPEMTDTTRNR